MNITVYLGASSGNSAKYAVAAEEMGEWIGKNGHSLIYGGSREGLMGALARGALKAGAHVTGVEPAFFIDSQLQLEELPELIITKDMAERKKIMIEKGDAYIAFPGGTGTLEEITEIMSMTALSAFTGGGKGSFRKPCILFNLDGYYDNLKLLLKQMMEEGFSTPERLSRIFFADSLEEIADLLTLTDPEHPENT